MSLRRLIYVSASLLEPGDVEEELAALVAQARSRNQRLSLSGCLLFSGGTFAQLLEGSEEDVRDVMRSICADRRHEGVRVIEETSAAERCFSSWGLGFGGPSLYVTKAIRAAVRDADNGRREGIENLRRLMIEFTIDRPR
jgi:hypothetical protein